MQTCAVKFDIDNAELSDNVLSFSRDAENDNTLEEISTKIKFDSSFKFVFDGNLSLSGSSNISRVETEVGSSSARYKEKISITSTVKGVKVSDATSLSNAQEISSTLTANDGADISISNFNCMSYSKTKSTGSFEKEGSTSSDSVDVTFDFGDVWGDFSRGAGTLGSKNIDEVSGYMAFAGGDRDDYDFTLNCNEMNCDNALKLSSDTNSISAKFDLNSDDNDLVSGKFSLIVQ